MIRYDKFKPQIKPVELKYILTVPTEYSKDEKLPLIVFLHGAGERGDDIENVKVHGVPKLFCNDCDYNGTRTITLSPLCPEDITWLDLKKELFALIESVCSEYNIDTERVALCGISMGGFGTWELAMTRPEMFCKIAPMCSGGMSWRANVLKMPIRAFHGRLDDDVPLELSQVMVDAVNASGGDATLTIYDDLSHNCWDRAFEQTDLINWLVTAK